MVTSGFTFGAPFSKNLDVNDCKINRAYEEVSYSKAEGIRLQRTELWDILTKDYEWNEEEYEACINNAAEEIHDNCYAVFSSSYFNKYVVDVSGGFDSRVVFAAVNTLPNKLKSNIYTYSRHSNTNDDFEKAMAICNVYNYPKYYYSDHDQTRLNIFESDNQTYINLDHISRTLGLFSCNSHIYSSSYSNRNTIELTGYLGEVTLGYMRCRGEINYKLGDQRLLARLGGCYIYNNVEQLFDIFDDQRRIINKTLQNYSNYDCLFKKNQILYVDFRNRFMCGSTRNTEHDNFRIPMCFSKYALKAKWMYFSQFSNNTVPDEKISMDLTNKLDPLLANLPYASQNDNVLTPKEKQLHPVTINIVPDFHCKESTSDIIETSVDNSYRNEVLKYTDNLEIVEQMLLVIYDYSDEYYSACLGLYKVFCLLKINPQLINTSHVRETIRKIYDIYYQIKFCSS